MTRRSDQQREPGRFERFVFVDGQLVQSVPREAAADTALVEILRDLPTAAEHEELQLLVAAGGPPRQAWVSRRGETVCVSLGQGPAPWGLTTRQLEVLTGVAAGMTNAEIAASLVCTTRTVATHIEHILQITGRRSRVELAVLAVRWNLVLISHRLRGTPLGARARTHLLDGPAAEAPSGPARAAAAKRPVLLAAVYPSGRAFAQHTSAMRRGLELAAAELNARGEVAGRRLELMIHHADVNELETVLDTALARGADAVVLGNFPFDETLLSRIELAASSGAPVLHSMVAPQISEAVAEFGTRLSNVFQVCGDEVSYAHGFARLLEAARVPDRRRDRRDVAMVVRTHMLATDYVDVAERLLHRAGWRLSEVRTADHVRAEPERVAAEFRRAGVAAVHLPILDEDSLLRMTDALQEGGERPLVAADWSPSSPAFGARFGRRAEGLYWSTVIGLYDDHLGRAFQAAYRDRFGHSPEESIAAVHYDIVNVLGQSWSRVRRPWDFGAVRASLRSSVVRGVAGPYHFGGRGQRALTLPDDTADASLGHRQLHYRIRGGRNVPVA
ncbi:LuxR C-terminal-related transcriptional regulator [Pseudonocardia sichuanensis]